MQSKGGNDYRIVMPKTRAVMVPTEQPPEMLEVIIEGLSPRHDPNPWPPFLGLHGTGASVQEGVIDVSVGKAPGQDGVPNLALKEAIAEASDMFRSAMQKCLGEGVFPEVWKRQTLVLLTKAGKQSVQHKRKEIHCYPVVTLDVRNAFNELQQTFDNCNMFTFHLANENSITATPDSVNKPSIDVK